VPAREGALRVLRARAMPASGASYWTSSFAAIGYGQDEQKAPFTRPTGPDATPPTCRHT